MLDYSCSPFHNSGTHEKRLMHNLHQYKVPLQRCMAMMDLQERNERLFYKLLIDNVEELLPVVSNSWGKILEVLKNWPERSIQVIVVTDGEHILGLGDLGCQGMGIPVGKISLYTTLGGLCPSVCLPVTIDVGTNNDQLLKDEFYIGLKQMRATGQFEDFANDNAFELLAKYSKTHLVFNDDIQGTTSVVLAGLIASLKLVGGSLAEHTFLFLGPGETKAPLEETRTDCSLSHGITSSLQHFKKPWAHEHEPIRALLDAVKSIKPTVLIGSLGVGKTFTKEVVEAMTSFNF
ncbi:NADP-dependent malic enzyme, chloroplastic [Vitis vinifera]|uniref:NADP-dependent malic enzyme, chloroplastic n=1 Tax=Vitis vinifera TaxID=29760 RepID=A0A438J6Y2_VITVI|nr:NADP-dependent malic enzyme, chloroplastic [Vitis vinifera]